MMTMEERKKEILLRCKNRIAKRKKVFRIIGGLSCALVVLVGVSLFIRFYSPAQENAEPEQENISDMSGNEKESSEQIMISVDSNGERWYITDEERIGQIVLLLNAETVWIATSDSTLDWFTDESESKDMNDISEPVSYHICVSVNGENVTYTFADDVLINEETGCSSKIDEENVAKLLSLLTEE